MDHQNKTTVVNSQKSFSLIYLVPIAVSALFLLRQLSLLVINSTYSSWQLESFYKQFGPILRTTTYIYLVVVAGGALDAAIREKKPIAIAPTVIFAILWFSPILALLDNAILRVCIFNKTISLLFKILGGCNYDKIICCILAVVNQLIFFRSCHCSVPLGLFIEKEINAAG